MHGTKNHQFGIALLLILAAKKIAKNRNITKSRHLAVDISEAIVQQTGDHKTLTISQLEFRIRFPRAKRGNRKSGNGQSIREIQLAD